MTGKSKGGGETSWVDGEIAACEFADVRLGRRFRTLLEQIGDAVGESVPMACQDWANTKAAYRFFSNERVDEGDILAGHFQPRVIASQRATALYWSSTTRRNSRFKEKARIASASIADAITLVAFALTPSAASCCIQASQ